MNVLKGLEPAPVFEHFEAICAIPHGSGHTKAISDHCASLARRWGLSCRQDEHDNLIIRKPGTPGYEHVAPVMLQGHLDMVAVKEPDCDLDLEREGLRLRLEDGDISAQGTSLGGDDGIAVAYALALLESTDIPHPPLEVVLTSDEEIGMLGAAALDMSDLRSRRMLNIDSEEEGYLLVSCAGGLRADCRVPVEREQCDGTRVLVEVSGCLGGHSGAEIDKGRANASLLLGRAVYRLRRRFPLRLVSVNGGSKENAIPRSAAAELVLAPEAELNGLRKALAALEQEIRAEYEAADPDIRLSCRESQGTEPPMTEESGGRVVTALMNLPAGIQKMSEVVPEMVQTSLNLGVMRTEGDEVRLCYGIRSSVEREKRELVELLHSITEELGGTVTESGDYPGWAYRPDSPLRDKMVEVFERLYGRAPVVMSLHAGVECGLFVSRLPGLDCVSFGPDMVGIHTPQERLNAESAARTWDYLLSVLKELR